MQLASGLLGLVFALGSLSGNASADQYPQLIRFFVVEPVVKVAHPDIAIHYYDIGELGATARKLNVQLSPRLSIAKMQAQARIESNFDAIRQALQAEAELFMLLDKFAIERFPAAVINDEIVIYDKIRLADVISTWREL